MAPKSAVIPRELPAELAGFLGRDREELDLQTLLTGAEPAAYMPVVVLSGIAGVGKTALAVRVGHSVAPHFPDGALYVDLLGFAPGEPRTPSSVLAGFLRSLGTPEANIPVDLHERASRFRTMLAGRRMLVMLDNALDAEQVRPLLPGETGCCVLVTSRNELIGLQVRHGAHTRHIEPLTNDDGAALLLAQLPSEFASPDTARRLAIHCAGLPLALRIVAAQITQDFRRRPHDVMDRIADELAMDGRLDLLHVSEDASVRAVFTWSEERLPSGSLRVFWLLGLHPLEELDTPALAALLDCDVREAQRHLDVLAQVHLVRPTRGGRVRMHDLLREHAGDRARSELPQCERDEAMRRLISYLVAATQLVMGLLQPMADQVRESEHELAKVNGLPPIRNPVDAQVWLVTEWGNLLRAITYTSRMGWTDLTGRLASVMRSHLDEGGRHEDALTVLGHALDVSRATKDPVKESRALRDLGAACLRLGRYDEAWAHYQQGIAVSIDCGDMNGHAGALNNLGNLFERLGDYAGALNHYEGALTIARGLENRWGEATLLNNVGFTMLRLGRHDEAMQHCHRSLEMFAEIGDLGGKARSLGNLGQIHLQMGDGPSARRQLDLALTQAREIGAANIETEVLNSLGETSLMMGDPAASLDVHREALDGAVETGDRYEQARALEGAGHAHRAMGALDLAVTSWLEAQAAYADLGVPEASRLAALVATPASDPAAVSAALALD